MSVDENSFLDDADMLEEEEEEEYPIEEASRLLKSSALDRSAILTVEEEEEEEAEDITRPLMRGIAIPLPPPPSPHNSCNEAGNAENETKKSVKRQLGDWSEENNKPTAKITKTFSANEPTTTAADSNLDDEEKEIAEILESMKINEAMDAVSAVLLDLADIRSASARFHCSTALLRKLGKQKIANAVKEEWFSKEKMCLDEKQQLRDLSNLLIYASKDEIVCAINIKHSEREVNYKNQTINKLAEKMNDDKIGMNVKMSAILFASKHRRRHKDEGEKTAAVNRDTSSALASTSASALASTSASDLASTSASALASTSASGLASTSASALASTSTSASAVEGTLPASTSAVEETSST